MTARLQLVPDDREGERALAHRAMSGDASAFEQIYRAHSPRVFALCLRMTGSRQQATDLTQDVFVHIWERLGTWRGEAALSSWIHRLTVNLVLSNVRTDQRRQKRETAESAMTDESAQGDSRPGRSEGSARASVRPASVLEAVDLERAIAALPNGARTVFVLHDVEGYQHDEIAKMTGTAEGTCRAQLHRARRLLMEALEK